MPDSRAKIQTDPLRNFKFRVRIDHPRAKFGTMGFMSVDGLNVSTEVIPYREGGMNTTTQKMPGQTDFSPITLANGLIVGPNPMMRWMEELFKVIQGQGSAGSNVTTDFRAKMVIQVLAHPVTANSQAPGNSSGVQAEYEVFNAWPSSVSYSTLDAGANAIIVQQMVLAHEGFRMRLRSSLNGSLNRP